MSKYIDICLDLLELFELVIKFIINPFTADPIKALHFAILV